MKKALLGGEAKELVDPYFVFSFAGKEVSVMRFRFNTFNTSIILMNIQLKIKKKNGNNFSVCKRSNISQ